MEEHEDVRRRLGAIGTQPVDPALQSAHLTALAQMPARRSLRPKLRTAGVFLAGLLVGGSGLAAAGALPDPAQHAAHRVLDGVGIDVPDPERYHGPECGAEVKRNHGAYVHDDHDLAGADCGKPVGAGHDDDGSEGAGQPKGPCQGPPPWAGPNKASMTPEEKAAAQAEHAAQCGDEADDTDAAVEDGSTEADEPATTVTSTTEPPTTTTLGVTTTTAGEVATTSTTSTDPQAASGP